jgi:cytochrome c5
MAPPIRTRSSEDIRFFNQFMLVVIALHVIVLGFFVLARAVGAVQNVEKSNDPSVLEAVDERIRPPVQVAVAGQPAPEEPTVADAGAVSTTASATAGPLALPATTTLGGEEVFNTVCTACHAAGIAGAPRFGDAAAWAPRIAQGNAVLYRHSIQGFHGQQGFMPPKGGRPDLSDQSVHNAVDYMIAAAQE